jgi:hypothetical protein
MRVSNLLHPEVRAGGEPRRTLDVDAGDLDAVGFCMSAARPSRLASGSHLRMKTFVIGIGQ